MGTLQLRQDTTTDRQTRHSAMAAKVTQVQIVSMNQCVEEV